MIIELLLVGVVLSAIVSVESKNLMMSVLFLSAYGLLLGVIFYLMGAELVGLLQAIIFSGGVLTLGYFTQSVGGDEE